MSFVFSAWYFVMIILVAGIVASLLVFFKMDKTDKALIDEFVKSSTVAEQPSEPAAVETKQE